MSCVSLPPSVAQLLYPCARLLSTSVSIIAVCSSCVNARFRKVSFSHARSVQSSYVTFADT